MKNDRDAVEMADPRLGQHFLVSADKLSKLVEAAGIRSTDSVLEVGAGIGTVARVLPRSSTLTVVELDERLIGFLRENAPRAEIIRGDALEIIRRLSFDVLIGNLPHEITESLLQILPVLSFRTAILSVGDLTDLSVLDDAFSWSEVTRTTGDDFLPPQSVVSRIMRITPLTQERVGRAY